MDYPKLIKHIRETLLLSQTELVETFGVSFAMVSRWKNGHHLLIMRDRREIKELCKKNGIVEE